MNEVLERVTGEAMTLPPAQRAELVERLLETLEGPLDERIEAAWAREAEERIRAYDAGEFKSTDGDEVLRRVLARKKP